MRLATGEELVILEKAGKILSAMGYTYVHIQMGNDKDITLPASSGHPDALAFIAQDAIEHPVNPW